MILYKYDVRNWTGFNWPLQSCPLQILQMPSRIKFVNGDLAVQDTNGEP
jgi:hypothetical protein